MAQFLTTSGTSHYLEKLILNATSQLVLVTPFLQLSQNFIERLRDADDKGIHIILIYGKDRLNQKEWRILNELRNIDIFFCENLHAKCYQNDDSLIISSMNLYQFSQQNNREMSILIDKENDNEVYEDASEEIQSIINSSILDKSSGKMSEIPNHAAGNGSNAQVQVDPKFNDTDNFHLPLLFELLKKKYTNTEFEMKENAADTDLIAAKNFPLQGIDMEVEDRIFFHFDDQHQETIWYKKKPLLSEHIQEAKIYVNSNDIKIYWRQRTSTAVSEQNLPIKADAYLNIISKATEILS